MAPNTEEFNKDEVDAPQWLNNDLFTKVLHSCQKDDTIKLKSLKLSPATVKGDHYASVMFRVNVDYESAKQSELQSMSMIIKTMPEIEGVKKELLKQSYIFETEIAMYSKVIPKYEAVLRSIGDQTIMGARCLYHSLSPRKFIVFEDIVPLGYTMLRDRQVNMEEAKAAILKLAKWHAISYKINKENSGYFDEFKHSVMSLSNMTDQEFMTGGIRSVIELLETQPKLIKYKPYFEAIEENFFERCKSSFLEYRVQPQDNALYVLCHGDFHGKNMMFKNNPSTGQLEDVMLLDYQMCYVGPIANDVIYSLYMLMDKQLRTQHLDEILYYYFSNFVDTLRRIGYEGEMPKMIKFREMMMQHQHLEIYLLTTFLPFWYSFRDGAIDPDDMMASSDIRKSMYQNKAFIAELEECLPRYVQLGYFDN